MNKLNKILITGIAMFLSAASLNAQTAVEPSGSGTEADPYLISEPEHLYWLDQEDKLYNLHFKQTADIDISSSISWNEGLGYNVLLAINVHYDGGGHVINGLYINNPDSSLGFFGLGVQVIIKDLGLTNVNITGGIYVGSLAGTLAESTIINCYSTGVINGVESVGGLIGFLLSGDITDSYSSADVSGTIHTGGLVGLSSGKITGSYSTGKISGEELTGGLVGEFFSGEIYRCHSTSQVDGSGDIIGGLVGLLEGNSKIEESYYSGAAHGTSSYIEHIGGLVGLMFDSDIINSYSVCSTGGFHYSGGLVGYMASGNIINSYSASILFSKVFILLDAAGFIGFNNIGNISNSFWDIDVSYYSYGVGIGPSVGLSGKSTSEMKDPITFISAGWDLGNSTSDGASDIWDIDLSGIINNGYPFLSWQNGSSVNYLFGALSGSGTSIDPYLITNLDDLYWLTQNSAEWGNHFKQTADIDASSSSTWDDGKGFTPIGNNPTGFAGTYDGGGKTITGLYINRSTSDYIALFGRISGSGVVKNIGLINVNITANNYVGGLAGYCNIGSIISTSYTTGAVSGISTIGGLVGFNSGNISDCYSKASVSGDNLIGGLTGFNGNEVFNSYSTGLVSGTSYNIGGLAGYNDNVILNSFWDTEASGQSSGSYGTGKTTAELQNPDTYLNTGWDFEGETSNGTENIWDIDLSGSMNSGYPFLSWENGDASALPVELSSFTAEVFDNTVVLNWQTATEVNNYGFEIERQNPPLNPLPGGEEKEWVVLGFLPGHGNSNSPKEYQFVDEYPLSGELQYRLKQIDTDGSFEYYGTILEVNLSITGIAEEILPADYSLSQNYPNPFNPTTTIKYGLPEESSVKIIVYNLLGEAVTILTDEVKKSGYYEDEFKASNLASGTYFFSIYAQSTISKNIFTTVKKMILVK